MADTQRLTVHSIDFEDLVVFGYECGDSIADVVGADAWLLEVKRHMFTDDTA